jgi:predicted nucleotidyltransferase
MEEKLIRKVTLIGNGAHVFVPKEWSGEQIALIRPEKKSLKERIISLIEPHLDSIAGVYLYGSHARAENIPGSDIDLLIITTRNLKIKADNFEIICLQREEIKKAIKIAPVLIYSILSEATPLINSALLEELREQYKPKTGDFTEYFDECRRIIKINEEFIKEEKGRYMPGEAVVYSLILRLRGIFIIKSILSRERYSHKQFKSWIKSHLPKIDFDSVYGAYRSSKNEEPIRQRIKTEDLKMLLEFLRKEVSEFKNGKKGKKARERN